MAIAIGILIGLVVGAALTVAFLVLSGGSAPGAARRARGSSSSGGSAEAESLRREAQLEAKEESVRLRDGARARRPSTGRPNRCAEERLPRGGRLDRRVTELDRREQGITDREVHAGSSRRS